MKPSASTDRSVEMTQRRPIDVKAYIRRSQDAPCFVCELLAGNPDYRHHSPGPADLGIPAPPVQVLLCC